MNGANDRPLVAIVGPTGAGKSELAIRIAEVLDGEIVNCDSLQIYKYFDIGTAKLPIPERRRIPHHLIDVAEPDEIFSAGEYGRRAREVVAEIAARGRVPVVAGGTGFYLRALLDGLPSLPARNEELRCKLALRDQRRPGSLHSLLRRLDPGSAARIHASDRPKTMRALEVRLLTGAARTAHSGAQPLRGFQVTKLALFPPRAELYAKLDLRTEAMFQHGLMEEVRSLLARGVSPSAKPFESLGYAQALRVLRDEIALEQAIADTQQATRRYAKRQLTWFRHEPGVQAIPAFGAQVDVRQWIESR